MAQGPYKEIVGVTTQNPGEPVIRYQISYPESMDVVIAYSRLIQAIGESRQFAINLQRQEFLNKQRQELLDAARTINKLLNDPDFVNSVSVYGYQFNADAVLSEIQNLLDAAQ